MGQSRFLLGDRLLQFGYFCIQVCVAGRLFFEACLHLQQFGHAAQTVFFLQFVNDVEAFLYFCDALRVVFGLFGDAVAVFGQFFQVDEHRIEAFAEFAECGRDFACASHAAADFLQLADDILFRFEQVIVSGAVGAFDVFGAAEAGEFAFELLLI